MFSIYYPYSYFLYMPSYYCTTHYLMKNHTELNVYLMKCLMRKNVWVWMSGQKDKVPIQYKKKKIQIA